MIQIFENLKVEIPKIVNFILSETEKTITKNNGADFSTKIDAEIERTLKKYIKNIFPEHQIIGEELKNEKKNSDFKWYIDPIDGTKYFINEVPLWSTSVALFEKDEPLFSIIYQKSTEIIYSAYKGKGAFKDDTRLNFNPLQSNKSQIAHEFIFHRSDNLELHKEAYLVLNKLQEKFYRVRNFGTGALTLCWLAQSMLSLYIIPFGGDDKQFLDISAGILIASESGAVIKKQAIGNNKFRLFIGSEESIALADDIIRSVET